MEITEAKLYEAFGLDPEGGNTAGGNDQGAADSDTGNTNQNNDTGSQDNGRDAAETVANGNTDGSTGASADNAPAAIRADQSAMDAGADAQNNTNGTPTPGVDLGQSEAERRANAARRRQTEMKTAIDDALSRARQQWEQERAQQQADFFEQAGLVNPFTKEPITNMDEFRAWREKQDETKLQKELQSGKLTQETLNKLIEKNPAVQGMQQEQEARRREAEQARQRAMQESVQRQLDEIRKTDPSIRDVADLLERPYGKALYEFVRRGNNFVDAFYLANREQMQAAQRRAAQQAAVNNITGKDHLKATSIGGRPGATVTQEEREMYHLFNPKATDADIQKFQNKFKKG